MIKLNNESKKGGHDKIKQQTKERRAQYTLTTNQRKEGIIHLDNKQTIGGHDAHRQQNKEKRAWYTQTMGLHIF